MRDIDELTREIIGCAMKVHRALGYGFLESVYKNALCIELASKELNFSTEDSITVMYAGRIVGSFESDLFVENSVIIELKAVDKINPVHEVQLVNYLKATNIDHGLLLNFGSRSLDFRHKYRTRLNPIP